jgi:hypothetical protein
MICCPGDVYPTNLNCPEPCDSMIYCCAEAPHFDTYLTNKKCPCPPFQPKCHDPCNGKDCDPCDSN